MSATAAAGSTTDTPTNITGARRTAMQVLDDERAKRARSAGHIHLTYLHALECRLPGCNGQ